MKKQFLLFAFIFLVQISLFAQTPNQFKYQAVLRNADGTIIANAAKTVTVEILQGSPTGTVLFTENHSVTTTAQGIINLNIGSINTTGIAAIDWSADTYFVKISVDGTEMGTSQLLSVPYALNAKNVENETDPVYGASVASGITTSDTANWNNKLDSFTETDPVYNNAVASGITAVDTANWNNKLDSFTETDPIYNNAVASGITAADTANWNNKLDSFTETDPVYNSAVASGITAVDTANWNNKLDSFTETDPVYNNAVASGITAVDTANWNNKLDSFTETDPVYNSAVASGITAIDTSNWNNKIDSIIETDPLYNSSVASGITSIDTTNWNKKSEFDSNYIHLTNAPDIANSVSHKAIMLNTNDTASSFAINKNNGSSVFKVDASGRMAGDGSGLSNIRTKISYLQGNQSVYFHEGAIPGLNLYEAQKMREVTINCPGPGIIFAMATGYVDFESTSQDLIRIWFFPHPTITPTNSWETPDFHNLRIIDDHGCSDSSDVYDIWSISKIYVINSAQDYTVSVCADKPFTESKVLVGDVVLSLIFIPTGGTGPADSPAFKEEEMFVVPKNYNSITGE